MGRLRLGTPRCASLHSQGAFLLHQLPSLSNDPERRHLVGALVPQSIATPGDPHGVAEDSERELLHGETKGQT